MNTKRWWMDADGMRMYRGNCFDTPLPTDIEMHAPVPLSAVVVEEGTRPWAVLQAMKGKRISRLYPDGTVSTTWGPEQIIMHGADDYKWIDLDTPKEASMDKPAPCGGMTGTEMEVGSTKDWTPPKPAPVDSLSKEERVAVEWYRGQVRSEELVAEAGLLVDIADRFAPKPPAPWVPEPGTMVRGWTKKAGALVIGYYRYTNAGDGAYYVTPDKGGKFLSMNCSRIEPLEGGKP